MSESSELPKAYEPAAVEAEAYRVWIEEKAFHAEPDAPGPSYTIVIPPPNVTGALHLGHAIDNTLQDVLVRRKRMQGFNALWMPGIDHAGIATQAVVERELKEKHNKTRHDVGRDALVKRIWEWKEQYGNRILNQLQRLGASCDWDRARFTLDAVCARAVRETFFKLFKDGLIYRGQRLVNWDTHLQTAVADDEIFTEDVKGHFWTFRYPVKDQPGQYIRFSTTRPETMLGDTAVAVHPDDSRYQHLIGKLVTIPLVGRDIPIIADDELVDPKLGTGAVKVTPAHDPNDYACWQRHKDEIAIINILTLDGKINDNGGKYAGLSRTVARERVTQDMESAGLFEGREDRIIPLAHSDRSKTPIEPLLSDQWFVKMSDIAERSTGAPPVGSNSGMGAPPMAGIAGSSGLAQLAIDAVTDGRVKFFPERYAKTYLDWLGEKRDWCISRQLWWGHRIPVWHSKPGMYGRSPNVKPNINEYIGSTTDGDEYFNNHHEHATFDPATGWTVYHCLKTQDPVAIKQLEDAGFVQDPDVLDTWFSSALWPHSTLGWPGPALPDQPAGSQNPEWAAMKRYYPTSVLVTGRDIITLWVARMVITGRYNLGDKPFHDVCIHPTILDGKGERMSKSKGNGVDPVDIIDTHGADAMRFTLTQMATETQDVRMPVKKDAAGRNTSDKFDVGRNFCNKLWNAARFAFTSLAGVPNEPVDESKWTILDRWILSRLARTVQACDQALDAYRFDAYAKACYDYFWRDLCDWYIEAVKPELKDGAPRRAQVANVLAAALDGALRLMHPMIPFITETIWWRLNAVRPGDRSIPGRLALPAAPRLIRASWPTWDDSITSEGAEHVFGRLQDLIGAIRTLRNDYKVDPKKPVAVSVAAPGDAARQIEANRATIELLATCELRAVAADLPPLPNAARATGAGCEIYVEGLVDADAEAARAAKKREELAKQIVALRGRLSNEAYTAKAPPHLVQQTRDQLAAAEGELAKL